MRERPIIMSVESVRAILAGWKTQTRRVLNPQPSVDGFWHANGVYGDTRGSFKKPCEPGDLLWVKEKFCIQEYHDIRDTRPPLVRYMADYYADEFTWNNPMFMPRKFSRLTLKVIDVRIERLPTSLRSNFDKTVAQP